MDTRQEYKNYRDSFNFPKPLPSNFNTSYGENLANHTPNYDRNMFQT